MGYKKFLALLFVANMSLVQGSDKKDEITLDNLSDGWTKKGNTYRYDNTNRSKKECKKAEEEMHFLITKGFAIDFRAIAPPKVYKGTLDDIIKQMKSDLEKKKTDSLLSKEDVKKTVEQIEKEGDKKGEITLDNLSKGWSKQSETYIYSRKNPSDEEYDLAKKEKDFLLKQKGISVSFSPVFKSATAGTYLITSDNFEGMLEKIKKDLENKNNDS